MKEVNLNNNNLGILPAEKGGKKNEIVYLKDSQ